MAECQQFLGGAIPADTEIDDFNRLIVEMVAPFETIGHYGPKRIIHCDLKRLREGIAQGSNS